MNTALTLKTYSTTAPKSHGAAPAARTLACNWDMLAVIGLMASSAAYGVYALTQMTGF